VKAAPASAGVWAALLVVYVVWGSTYLGILLAIRTLPVFLMTSVRFLAAGALLLAWSRWRGGGSSDPLGKKQWAAAAVAGALLFLVGNTGVALAEKRVDSGIASLLAAAVPLWLALFDRVACGQRLGKAALVGLALGFGGVGLLAWPSGPSRLDLTGTGFLLVAGAAWAAGSLYSRRAPLPRRPLVSSGLQMLLGGSLLLVVALASGEETQVHDVSATSALALAYLIVFGSVLAFSAYAWLLRNARTSLVSTYAYVNPVVAVFLGWSLESEPIGVRTVVAGAIILFAVALIVTPPRGERAEVSAVVPARGR
jgi:drug/metabolite transporter (DMT)-like permease